VCCSALQCCTTFSLLFCIHSCVICVHYVAVCCRMLQRVAACCSGWTDVHAPTRTYVRTYTLCSHSHECVERTHSRILTGSAEWREHIPSCELLHVCVGVCKYANTCVKELFIYAKEPYIFEKEPFVCAKMPCTSAENYEYM